MMGLVDRIMERPWVYRLWQAPFAEEKFSPIAENLALHPPARRVLDVGCGPGTNASRFAHADYVGLDINEAYLEVARRRHRGRFIQADLATADLSHLGLFDVVLVNSFLHHLPDRAVDTLLAAIAERLDPRGHIHVLELVLPDRLNLARVMARIDRGRYARSEEAWTRLFERHFETDGLSRYMLGGWLWSMMYFRGRTKRCVSP